MRSNVIAKTSPTPSLKDEVRDALRKRKGKFRTIADLSGWSYSSLHKFMSGEKNNPSYDRLKRLADLFASGVI